MSSEKHWERFIFPDIIAQILYFLRPVDLLVAARVSRDFSKVAKCIYVEGLVTRWNAFITESETSVTREGDFYLILEKRETAGLEFLLIRANGIPIERTDRVSKSVVIHYKWYQSGVLAKRVMEYDESFRRNDGSLQRNDMNFGEIRPVIDYKTWYENGQIKEDMSMVDSARTHRSWYESGQIRERMVFFDESHIGAICGAFNEWHENGILRCSGIYEQGTRRRIRKWDVAGKPITKKHNCCLIN